MCAAKFSDGEWYRARVEKVAGNQVYTTNNAVFDSGLVLTFFIDCRYTCSMLIMEIGKSQLPLNAYQSLRCMLDPLHSPRNSAWLVLLFPKMYSFFFLLFQTTSSELSI